MRENLAQWDYVIAAYAVMIIGTLALLGWSLRAMRRAEARKDKARGK